MYCRSNSRRQEKQSEQGGGYAHSHNNSSIIHRIVHPSETPFMSSPDSEISSLCKVVGPQAAKNSKLIQINS